MIAAVLLAIALAALAAAPAFAEGDEGAADPVAFENEELDLDMTELCHYYDKDDYDSTVYYTLSLESGTAAFFSTSAKSVARIDEEDEGSVTLHLRKPGSVIIRAHNEDGNAVAACRLNITATLKDLEVKAVSDDEDEDEYSGTIAPGKTLQLKACVFPSFVPEPEISWSSSNEECAEVDEAGLVTLKKRGPVKITAEAAGGISDEYPVVWSEKVVSGDYTYRVINTDEAEIVSYKGTDKEVVIPETLDGYRVTAIGGYHDYYDDGAFSGCYQLQKITVPGTIRSIGDRAFCGCSRLTTVILNCDADIPASAFKRCEYLSEVQINGNPKEIGAEAFYECSRLKSITLPEGVEEIGASAFNEAGLRSIELPDSLEEIGESAFYRCSSLGSIELPDSLKVIGTGAFSGTSIDTLNIGENVESIGMGYGTGLFSVAEANPNYSSKGGALYDKSGKKLLLYWGRSSVNHLSVPAGTETIGEGAFVYANDLRQLDFPETLVSIEKEALPANAWNLEIVFPKSLRTVGENNIKNSNVKVYYRGSASDWNGIDIDYYGNDGLTENPDIVYNHKKTGLKLAKTKVSCTYAESPKIKVTYSDGSRVKPADAHVLTDGDSVRYADVNREEKTDYVRIYPETQKGNIRVCVVAGGCAVDIYVEVTGPTPLSKCKFKWGYIDEYNGKAQKPCFDLKAPDGSYINSSDYTIKYQNNVNVGTAKAVITGTEKCSGSITRTFVIAPKRPDTYKVTGGTRSAVVKWKKITKQVTGYQIQYSLNSKFKSPKTITVKGYNTTSRKITGLKSNKDYHFQMRTYRKIGGKTYYSKWSYTWDVYIQ